ncbi:MAG: TlpA family protein disulfide reductase [Myxococcaceae bacterium]
MPELEKVRQQYEGQGVGFLALSLEPDAEVVAAAAARFGVTMKVAVAEDEVLGPFGVNQVPSTIFIDRDGLIVAAASGERSRAFLERRVKALLEP